jgi:hypothetical protein
VRWRGHLAIQVGQQWLWKRKVFGNQFLTGFSCERYLGEHCLCRQESGRGSNDDHEQLADNRYCVKHLVIELRDEGELALRASALDGAVCRGGLMKREMRGGQGTEPAFFNAANQFRGPSLHFGRIFDVRKN